jgi:periplasmic glucans biosynthesis protein
MQRRDWLKAAAALAAAGVPLSRALPAAGMGSAPNSGRKVLGKPQPFDYAWLKGRARTLAGAEYQPPSGSLHPDVAKLDWDGYQAIRYRDSQQLWTNGDSRFRAAFFHLGLFFTTPVHLHEVANGMAQEIAYDPAMFDYGKSGLDSRKLPRDLGFAGFRVLYHTDPKRDVAAFLGASYFRAVSGEMQYGLSARGLAVDCGMNRPEEFPSFTAFWLERPAPGAGKLTVYALLESPSITGAYRFDIAPGGSLVMDVDAALYPRREIERLGIAPLTSMFAYGENDRRAHTDWRPEIHDSDGLAMWTGGGEWIWRPLVNPPGVRFNSYADANPRGFGLLQRDRSFENYQDDGAFYERRPSVWVEPKGSWGKGQVQLLEFATDGETDDNIAAFWNPAEPPRPGAELLYSYRLHWGTRAPVAPPLAHTVATRTGVGGIVGKVRNYFSWRFVVDFAGPNFAMLDPKAEIVPVISASRGEIEIASARPLKSIGGYRAMFDLKPTDDRAEPVNLRLFLKAGTEPLTETWLYQWSPPPAAERAKLVAAPARAGE